jgi:sugar (pentulose or hexulose) kinase
MLDKDYHIAVIDLGKTRKKVSVYDRNLTHLLTESVNIPVRDIEGFEADDVEAMWDWIVGILADISGKYNIKVISTTSFGATFVCLDSGGNLVFPVTSYTNEPAASLKTGFYREFGSREVLGEVAGSPVYNIALNAGYSMYWLKNSWPERWRKVKHILFLPQYISYRLSGQMSVDVTSLGCHTLLYDFKQNDWSHVARKLGVVGLIPERLSHPWESLGTIQPQLSSKTGIAEDCQVVCGIHDSNASLLPYLIRFREEFLLASTGTWCIFLKPNSTYRLNIGELEQDTLYYIDAFGKPFRAAKFMGGDEHDHYSELIARRFGKDPLQVKYDSVLVREILQEKDCFILPTLHPGTGLFPGSKARIVNENKYYSGIEYAYHVLCLSLALRSFVGLSQVIIDTSDFAVYVEGGFRNNTIYLNLLSAFFTRNEAYVTNRKEATSYGAAICGRCGLEDLSPDQVPARDIDIEKFRVQNPKIDHTSLMGYLEKYISQCCDLKEIPDSIRKILPFNNPEKAI